MWPSVVVVLPEPLLPELPEPVSVLLLEELPPPATSTTGGEDDSREGRQAQGMDVEAFCQVHGRQSTESGRSSV